MNRPTILVLTLLCSVSALGAQATAEKKPAMSSLSGIREVARAFTDAANARDAAKIANLYANDAVVMPPHQEMVKGRPQIQAFWQGMLDQGARDVTLTPLSVSSSGTVAYEAGTYQFTMAPSTGQPMTDRGKYLVGLRRDASGKWQIAYDVFNSDLPCPPPAPIP